MAYLLHPVPAPELSAGAESLELGPNKDKLKQEEKELATPHKAWNSIYGRD